MEQVKLEIVLRAETPIAHHSETFGNTAVLMTQRMLLPSGEVVNHPIITGDTLRHGLREASTLALLDAAGLLGETLTEEALRLLFAGGMISGSSPAVKLDEYRELTELIPPLAILGGCAGNRAIPGRLMVEPAVLISEESAHLLPEWATEWLTAQNMAPGSSRERVEEVQRVRMDPLLDPGKRRLMTAAARGGAEQKLLISEVGSKRGAAKEVDEGKSTMMPRRYETLIAGSLFFWRLTATLYDELERDTFYVMLAAFLRNPVVGGKRGTGCGRLAAVVGKDIQLARFSDRTDVLDLATGKVGDLFRAHVKARSERLRDLLGKIKA